MQLILAFAEEKRKVKKGLGDIIYRIIFCKPENSERSNLPQDFIEERIATECNVCIGVGYG